MDSSWLTTDAECVKQWSEALHREGEKQRWLGKFISTKANSIFREKTELEKKKGDEVTFTFVKNLTGSGTIDDEDMEDNEEKVITFTDKIRLRLRKNAVRTNSELDEKRVLFEFRTLGKDLLGRWRGQIQDNMMKFALSGLADPTGVIAASAPTTNRKWYGGQTTDGAVTAVADDGEIVDNTNFLFGSKVIEVIHRKAIMGSPIIPPIMLNGKEYYVYFAHPYQIKALRADSDWLAAHREVGSLQGTLFTGADSIWDGVVIHQWNKIESRLGGADGALKYFESGDNCYSGVTVARGLFCGLDAGAIAFGRPTKWVEKDFGYDEKHGICVKVMVAIKKIVFDSEDNGVVVVDTAVKPD